MSPEASEEAAAWLIADHLWDAFMRGEDVAWDDVMAAHNAAAATGKRADDARHPG
jgi:hypothetical protein